MNYLIKSVTWSISLTSSLIMHPVLAQVVTDGSVGAARAIPGPNMTIGAELGTTKGANLFHSFQSFNIQKGESATFTGPAQIQNVISRVTGGKTSTLDGTLRSQVGKADVYLINPSGIIMGPNAQIDVPAAFHASTADELRFSDGSVYSASDPGASTLTIAPPESFGFLSPQPATITVNGSKLEFKPGQTATLTAGDVTITGESADKTAQITAPGGKIRIEAVGKKGGKIPVTKPSDTPGNGDVTLKYAKIDTSGEGGGLIALRAGSANLEDSQLIAENQGASAALGGLDLRVQDALRLTRSYAFADTTAAGKGGMVNLQAGELQMDGSLITSDSYRNSAVPFAGPIGDAGGITLSVDGLMKLWNGSEVHSYAVAEGNAGGVTVNAGSLLLDYRTHLASDANSGSSGNAGTVTANVSGLVEILNGALISSDTWSSGDAGGVVVNAGSLRLDGAGSDYITGLSSDAAEGTGHAGSVTVNVSGRFEILNGAQVFTGTWGAGDAGSVTVNAGSLRLDGTGSDKFTGLASSAETGSSGNAGTVTATVSGLAEILNGAEISSSTFSLGDAGGVVVNAGSLRLDRAGSNYSTGLASTAEKGSSGNAGTVNVTVSGLAEILNGAEIRSNTFSLGNAGSVVVNAGSLRLDRAGSNYFTGLASNAEKDSSGNAGTVTATVSGLAEILNGADISSNTFSLGDAGSVTVNAGSMRLDRAGSDKVTGLASSAETGSSGNAGTVTATVSGLAEILNGAEISSNTFSLGDAGSVVVNAGSLRLDRAGSDKVTGLASNAEPGSSGNAGSVTANVSGLAEILNGGIISSDTWSSGNAGGVTINAGLMRLDGTGSDYITGLSSDALEGTGHAGSVTVNVSGLVEILNGGTISSATFSSGNAGSVTVNAGSLRLDGAGSDKFIGLVSSAEPGSSGNAGSVTATVSGRFEILNGGTISSATFSSGDAGGVVVNAGSLRLDGAGSDYFTGLASTAEKDSSGNAGTVSATVSGLVEILNGAEISSSTGSSGNAGQVKIQAGEMRLDNGGLDRFTGIYSNAYEGSTGNSGQVILNINGLLEIQNAVGIGSATFGAGKGGDVFVHAGEVRADGKGFQSGFSANALSSSSNDAGTVTLEVDNLLELRNGAQISSNTGSSGNAGSVTVNAGSLRLDRAGSMYFTGLSSNADLGSSGDAGKVTANVSGFMEILNGAQVSTATFGAGNAGDTHIHASDLLIMGLGSTGNYPSGIFSAAEDTATGQVGNVSIEANNLTLRDGGTLSIQADQTLPDPTTLAHFDTRLSVNANLLKMDNGVITAASTGNVPAATLVINAQKARLTNGSRITTESRNANAGPIIIDGGWFWLDHSQVTTSANGQQGNGGDIVVNSKQLILDGGFIQANTAAQGAHGGDIYINSKALLMPGNQTLAIGELQRQVFDSVSQRNVIQAAAPGGEQGRIEVSGPLFDISGAIAGVHNPYRDPASLFRDPCAYFHTAHPSSLVDRMGGGAEIAPEKACTVPFIGERLDRALSAEKIVQKKSKQNPELQQKKKAKRKHK